jgi:hypothetical protein
VREDPVDLRDRRPVTLEKNNWRGTMAEWNQDGTERDYN